MVLSNVFDQATVFKPHSDFARHLEKIDEKRYCSGGDDGSIVIIDTEKRRIVQKLNGHTRPIACLHAKVVCTEPKNKNIPKNGKNNDDDGEEDDGMITSKCLLISSSSDHQIILWDVDDGSKFRVYSGEERLARVLMSIPIFPNYFFSGGEKLLAWHINKGMIDSCKPNESEDISFMLSIRNQFILIAVDNYVVVIEVLKKKDNKNKKIKNNIDNNEDDDDDIIPSFNLQNQLKLTSHRETITALNKIDDNCFLTGSLDGSIYQWSVNNNWSPIHRYNYVEGYLGDMRIYPYSVQSIITVKRFIIAGHGNSIHIYDATIKSLLVSMLSAHDSKITHLSTLYQGNLFASCSEDATIKIWRLSCKDPTKNNNINLYQNVKYGDLMIESLGTCSLHSASVMKCIAVEPNKFLSCSNDFRVILWMDGFSENEVIYKRLRHMMPY